MEYISTDIPDVIVFSLVKHSDERGFFMETFKRNVFQSAVGSKINFVQDNFSFSKLKGTVRGLHYQSLPHAQGKLVRCVRGRILDVAVDFRKKSPYFGQYVSAELTEHNGKQLWIPPGFLHGFSTLEPDCEVAYKCTNYYSSECDKNILWNDPDLAIDWRVSQDNAVLSAKDIAAPRFSQVVSSF